MRLGMPYELQAAPYQGMSGTQRGDAYGIAACSWQDGLRISFHTTREARRSETEGGAKSEPCTAENLRLAEDI